MALGSNPVAANSTSNILSVSGKVFLDIHVTTECRFTLKCVCNMIKTHKFPCHPCHIFEYVYPHTFYVNFLLKRHVTRDTRISCTSYHMEWTDNKPLFWQDVSLKFCNLAKSFKHYYIFGFHFPEAIKTTTMIHYYYCLMASGK